MADTGNYTLGKGVVYFNRKKDSVLLGELDLGNCPEFSYNTSLEKLDHFSSRGGLKAKDKDIVSQISPGVTFTLDELSAKNVALLSLGEVVEITQPAATAVDEEPGGAYAGTRLALANRNIDTPGVSVTTSGDVALTEGLDWAVDTDLKDNGIGRIMILDTYTGVEGDLVKVSYTAPETIYKKIKAITETTIEGFMRFVSDSPVGQQMELQFWRVSITPSGDTAMIGDDWSTLSFTGEILKDSSGHPDSPYYDIIMD